MTILLYSLLALVFVFAIVMTLVIGNSSENRTENTAYDKRTGKNFIRLISIYGLALVLIIIMFLWLT